MLLEVKIRVRLINIRMLVRDKLANLLAARERLIKTSSQLLVPIKETKEAGLDQQAVVEKACKAPPAHTKRRNKRIRRTSKGGNRGRRFLSKAI